MERRTGVIILTIGLSLTVLLLLISYLNVITSAENDWLQTVSKGLNITLLVVLILGLISGSMIYYYYIIHIEDLNRQCYVNLCVFFGSLFCVIVFVVSARLVEYRTADAHQHSHTVLTLINFFLLLVVLIIAVSGVLMLTILIMSTFWCFQVRAKRVLQSCSPALE